MRYYSVVYMKNGEIHMRPHASKEDAQATIDGLKATKWWPKVDYCKIHKGDARLTIPLESE